MVPLTGFEPVTYRLGGGCSILLSYKGKLSCKGLYSLRLEGFRGSPGCETRYLSELAAGIVTPSSSSGHGGHILLRWRLALAGSG